MMGKMEFLCCLLLFVSYTTSQNLELKPLFGYKSDTKNVLKGLKDLTKRKDVIIIEVKPNEPQNSENQVDNSDDSNSMAYDDVVESSESKYTDPELSNFLSLRALNDDGNRSHYGFSADYIDMAELARAEAELLEKGKQLIELKNKIKQTPTSSKITKYLLSKLFDEADDDQEISSVYHNNYDELKPYLGRRSRKRKSSSESVSADKSSKEKEKQADESVEIKEISKKQKAKSGSESGDSSDSENEVTTRRPRPKKKNIKKAAEKYDIIQSPFRKIRARKTASRLPKFLPKRYTWTSKELGDLGYFWFDGTQGRDPP